jgi:hypothetical protein
VDLIFSCGVYTWRHKYSNIAPDLSHANMIESRLAQDLGVDGDAAKDTVEKFERAPT